MCGGKEGAREFARDYANSNTSLFVRERFEIKPSLTSRRLMQNLDKSWKASFMRSHKGMLEMIRGQAVALGGFAVLLYFNFFSFVGNTLWNSLRVFPLEVFDNISYIMIFLIGLDPILKLLLCPRARCSRTKRFRP